MDGDDMIIIFFAYMMIGCLVICVELENAPTYDEVNDKFIYKEWYTIFGIKIKRNKKK
jgi:hypothetical protein